MIKKNIHKKPGLSYSFMLLLILLVLTTYISLNSGDFKSEQLKYDRVKEAFEEKDSIINRLLKEKGVNSNSYDLLLRAFKYEQEVELWAKNKNAGEYVFIKEYEICSSSGKLGPKRKQGDMQVPEGFYHISHFNPWSVFHLSLQVNYPNRSDQLLKTAENPGGEIFIHGNCVTIGCIPITDFYIKELYIFCMKAKNSGQYKIPVHILPARLTDENMQTLEDKLSGDTLLIPFWKNLKEGFDYFEENQKPASFTINASGKYCFTH